MGVIRNLNTLGTFEDNDANDLLNNIPNNQVQHQNAINDGINNNNVDGQNVDIEDEVRALHRQERNRVRRLRIQQSKKLSLKPEATFKCLGCRGKSYKKHRRYENANMLAHTTLGLDGSELLNDIDIHDFVPQTVSAFAQLFIENENMKAWNAFMNCTEDEQELILDAMDEEDDWNGDLRSNARGKKRMRTRTSSSPGQDLQNDEFDDNRKPRLESCSSFDVYDNEYIKYEDELRAKHPAYSPEDCFKRLDRNVKNLLKRKHIPLGLLSSIEEQIIDFFADEPLATYRKCLPTGFHRLLLRACCQYLDLNCQSFNEKGSRWSRVRNNKHFFDKPDTMLASYLEERFQRFGKYDV